MITNFMLKYSEKYIICLLAIVFIFNCLAADINTHDGVFEPKNAGFKKADALSIKADLLGVLNRPDHVYLGFCDISGKNAAFKLGYKYKKSPSKHSPFLNYPRIAVTPDETKVFLGMKKAILQFDSSYQLHSKIPFDLEPERKFPMFGNFLEASDETLYFSNFDGGLSIYSCLIADPQNTLKKTNYQFEGENLAFKETSENEFSDLSLFNPDPILVPMFQLEAKRKKIPSKDNEYRLLSPGSYVEFDIIEYAADKGWVFSTYFRHEKDYSRDIYFLKNKKSSPQKLNQGSFARWGADGWIYYIKRTGDLCRINPENTTEELVFKLPEPLRSKLVSEGAGGQDVVTRSSISRDRKLLAYRFSNKIAVFDLLKKEYRMFENIPMPITDFKFINIRPPLINYRKGEALVEKEDYKHAIKYLKKAAEGNNADALNMLGDMYANGYGVEQNYKEAAKYYIEASRLGQPDSMISLGAMHEDGLGGFTQNFTKAFELYKKAADSGNTYGLLNLGHMYENGRGVEPDYQRAKSYYAQAAREGNIDALNALAYFLAQQGTTLKAAEKGILAVLGEVPDEPDYLDTYGWVLFKQKRYDEALKQLQRAVGIKSDDDEIQHHLASTYCKLGRQEEAKKHWEKARALTENEELKKQIEEELRKLEANNPKD